MTRFESTRYIIKLSSESQIYYILYGIVVVDPMDKALPPVFYVTVFLF